MADPPEETAAAPLLSLGGKPAPEQLRADVRLLLDFPEDALARFWRLLGPSLHEPLPDSVEHTAAQFAAESGVPIQQLSAAARGCRTLIRNAVALGLDAAGLARDVEALLGLTFAAKALLAGYGVAFKQLQREYIQKAAADHGRLLTGVDWRVDQVGASKRGLALSTNLAVLTLHYTEGPERKRVSLQLLPEGLAELHEVVTRLMQMQGLLREGSP